LNREYVSVEKKCSILIVEDERIVAKDLQQTLVGMGYDAFAIASSAEEAIAAASEKCPDIVLMDIRIKGTLDGIQTAGILRSRFDVAIIYLTAHADEATLTRAKTTEAYGYLLKPVRPAELRSAVEVAVYKQKIDKRLRQRERWFSTTLRSIADAVVTVDLAGKITFINPAAEALIGLGAEDAIGKSVDVVLRLDDQWPPAVDATPLATALRMQQPLALKSATLLNLATGAQLSISDSTAPVIDDGQLLGAVMVFRDVTEEKRLQTRLELGDRLASLGTMAAGTVHELNNPLAIVFGNAALADDELQELRADLNTPSDEVEQHLNRISDALGDLQSAASRMGRIVSDLRVFAWPAEDTSQTMDLARCVEWAIRSTSKEFHHRAQVRTEFGATPAVNGDGTRLERVLINLLMNSAHAIEPGNADRNEVYVTTRADQQGRAVIEVRDTGHGIEPEVLKRIFEPFFTTKEVGIGTGLGLSICHGIVSSMGGEIHVESVLGKGTTFRILLTPAHDQGIEVAPLTSTPRRQGRILVIEDEVMILRLIRRFLEADGHEVTATVSAREALALIQSGVQFDMILTDLMMPVMDGMVFYETLLGQNPDIARRVAFISGGPITARVTAFLESVPNLQIDKPFTVATLRDTVQRLLVTAPSANSKAESR
jgi:two-component system cell cycle sensor histidine kinase/response regulator CckA